MKNLILTTGIAILCTLLSAWQYGINSMIFNGTYANTIDEYDNRGGEEIVLEIPGW